MDRNFLRAQLLPLLASRWPAYRRSVARASEHMTAALTALQETLPIPPTLHSVMGDPGLAVEELDSVPGGTAALSLRSWLQAAGYLAPDQAALEEFLRQLRESAIEASPRLVCSAFTLQRYREAIYLLPDSGEARSREPLTLVPGEICDVPGVGRIGLQPAAANGLLLAPEERIELAWRRGGVRCKPLGRSGGNSLKKLLQEREVPPWWRDRVPLLYLNDELLAVGDLWLCESSRWRESAGPGEQLWRVCWQRKTETACD